MLKNKAIEIFTAFGIPVLEKIGAAIKKEVNLENMRKNVSNGNWLIPPSINI